MKQNNPKEIIRVHQFKLIVNGDDSIALQLDGKEPFGKIQVNNAFTEQDWMKRFDNHEEMFRQQGKQICDQADYVFKLENKVNELSKIILAQQKLLDQMTIQQEQMAELLQRLCEKAVLKEE